MTKKALERPDAAASAEEAVLETLRAGYRACDAQRVLAAYAENVEVTIVNRNNPPSRPLRVSGREALRVMVEDICSREMSHEIVRVVAGGGSLAYRVECRYPDGCNVVGMYMASIEHGRIVSEFSVDCWDE